MRSQADTRTQTCSWELLVLPPCSFAAKRMPGRTHPSAEEVTEEKETEKFLQEKRQLCERCHRTGSSVRPFPGVERRRTAVRRCPPAALPAPRSIPPRTLAALVTLSARQHSQSGPKRGAQLSTAQHSTAQHSTACANPTFLCAAHSSPHRFGHRSSDANSTTGMRGALRLRGEGVGILPGRDGVAAPPSLARLSPTAAALRL